MRYRHTFVRVEALAELLLQLLHHLPLLSQRLAVLCVHLNILYFVTEFFVFNEIIAFANREDIQNLGKPYPLKIFFTYWSLIFLSVFVHLGGDAQLVVERGGVGVDTSGDDTP